jgi:hypothetical protein
MRWFGKPPSKFQVRDASAPDTRMRLIPQDREADSDT